MQGAPIILDVEASGWGRGGYPIEVGVATADGRSHCFLIRPERYWLRWDEEAEGVHGISRQVAERHGRPVKEVAQSLNALLHGTTVYSDGWGFDMPWLALLYDAAGEPQRFRVEHLHVIMNDAQLKVWDAVRAEVVAGMRLARHRASSDALIIQQTYLRSRAMIDPSRTPVPARADRGG